MNEEHTQNDLLPTPPKEQAQFTPIPPEIITSAYKDANQALSSLHAFIIDASFLPVVSPLDQEEADNSTVWQAGSDLAWGLRVADDQIAHGQNGGIIFEQIREGLMAGKPRMSFYVANLMLSTAYQNEQDYQLHLHPLRGDLRDDIVTWIQFRLKQIAGLDKGDDAVAADLKVFENTCERTTEWSEFRIEKQFAPELDVILPDTYLSLRNWHEIVETIKKTKDDALVNNQSINKLIVYIDKLYSNAVATTSSENT